MIKFLSNIIIYSVLFTALLFAAQDVNTLLSEQSNLSVNASDQLQTNAK